jgi:hypothetical protein
MAGSWLDGGGGGSAVDVVGITSEAEALTPLMDMVQAGALVSLGTTSDGGALGITVTVDGRWRREYVRTVDELRLYLAEAVPGVLDALAANGGRAGADRPSAASRGRKRR